MIEILSLKLYEVDSIDSIDLLDVLRALEVSMEARHEPAAQPSVSIRWPGHVPWQPSHVRVRVMLAVPHVTGHAVQSLHADQDRATPGARTNTGGIRQS